MVKIVSVEKDRNMLDTRYKCETCKIQWAQGQLGDNIRTKNFFARSA